jgi:hypothetical protein
MNKDDPNMKNEEIDDVFVAFIAFLFISLFASITMVATSKLLASLGWERNAMYIDKLGEIQCQ